MTDFHLWEVTCHGRGKEQPKNFQKKKCKLILLGIDHIFLTNSENFFSHSSRRESWTQPKCPVWKTTTMKNCVHKLGKTQCLIFNFFFRKYDNYKNRTDVMSLSNIIFDASWSFVKPALFPTFYVINGERRKCLVFPFPWAVS